MSTILHFLPALLWLVALGQALIALLNLSLVPLLGWQDDLARMSLLVRQVFRVHQLFISVTLALFAVLTWRFGMELAALPLGRWLAAGIAAFWAIRTVLQVVYYSPEHWKGQPLRLMAHLTLLVVYGGFTAVYAAAAFLVKGGAQ